MNQYSQKYGAFPKSHAALRFLPLRNCVVLSMKKDNSVLLHTIFDNNTSNSNK